MNKKKLNQLPLMKALVVFTVCLCAANVRSQEVPGKPWQMPDAEKTEFLKVFEMLSPGSGWKVTNAGNDFVMEHVKPVNFYFIQYGGPFNEEPPKFIFTQPFRVTLCFQPLMSSEQYKKYVVENQAAQRQHYKLLDKYKIRQKFDQFSLFGDDASERAKGYRTESAELKYHRLPQFYNLEYSVMALQSWHSMNYVDSNNQDKVAEECEEVLENIRRLFGTYDPYNAREKWLGYFEESRTKPIYPAELTIYGK